MAITNEKTLAKMKKKNLKSVRVGKDGSITKDGKTFKNKKEFKAREKKKKTPLFESPKSKAIRLSTESGKANTAATKKMYAAESMFNTAKARDDAKVTPGKKRPFPEAKAAAEKAGKDRFLYEGKPFFTTKGAADNRDKKKTRIAEKGVFKKKSNLDADTVASYKKRIKYMKDRKAKGKNFSAKNLKELEAKLAAN
jgi:ribosomal protein S30